jgi:hypothetical protein
MPEYLNISNTHLHVAEHKFIAPHDKVVMSEADAAPLVAKGWLTNVLSNIATEVVDGELSNFINELNHLPPTPIDINVDLLKVPDSKSDESETKDIHQKDETPSYIKEAFEREKEKRAKSKKTPTITPGVTNQEDVFDSEKYE